MVVLEVVEETALLLLRVELVIVPLRHRLRIQTPFKGTVAATEIHQILLRAEVVGLALLVVMLVV
jgi:hypothetical protein